MSAAERLQRAWAEGGWLAQLLRPLGLLYGALSALRARLYRIGWLRVATLPVPVIVVGNWIIGGAGKTPTTLALLRLLREQGVVAGVVSRGYGRNSDEPRLVDAASKAGEVGDEPLLIHLRSVAPVSVGRDRIAAAHLLLARHPEVQLIISDDGLQHWRLPRALTVLVFDSRGLGNGRLLPAGPLRQRCALSAEPCLVLYNAPEPSTALPGFLARSSLAGAVELGGWWHGEAPSMAALQGLRGRPLVAVAGMAQPRRFFDMLEALGLQAHTVPLPDHHDFAALPWPPDTPDVLLTEKDAVKLRPERVGRTRVWVVALDFRPEAAFEQALRERLPALLG